MTGSEPKGYWAYEVMKKLFEASSFTFFHSVEMTGSENMPPPGVPTLLCFNHGNGLCDPVLLISHIPRTVRFAAKDTLWKDPLFGIFIRNSGAVPVQRRAEHGKDANNQDFFSAMYEALADGDCVGIAPEGSSKYGPDLMSLKPGTARIALEAVKRGPADMKVHIVVVGINYLHREKWRSNVLLELAPPILVDRAMADREDSRATCEEITNRIFATMNKQTLRAPDASVFRAALLALRVYSGHGKNTLLPVGPSMTLPEFVSLLKFFINLLSDSRFRSSSVVAEEAVQCEDDHQKRDSLRRIALTALGVYRKALKASGLADGRVQWFAKKSTAGPLLTLGMEVCLRACMSAAYGLLALPGTLAWMPVWVLVKRREQAIMRKGIEGWFDTVTENKLLISFAMITAATAVAGMWKGLKHALALAALMWLSLRWMEDGIAAARELKSLLVVVRLWLRGDQLSPLVELRGEARAALIALMATSEAPPVQIRPAPWALFAYFDLRRRRKKDWNECLKFKDVEPFSVLGELVTPRPSLIDLGMIPDVNDIEPS